MQDLKDTHRALLDKLVFALGIVGIASQQPTDDDVLLVLGQVMKHRETLIQDLEAQRRRVMELVKADSHARNKVSDAQHVTGASRCSSECTGGRCCKEP